VFDEIFSCSYYIAPHNNKERKIKFKLYGKKWLMVIEVLQLHLSGQTVNPKKISVTSVLGAEL